MYFGACLISSPVEKEREGERAIAIAIAIALRRRSRGLRNLSNVASCLLGSKWSAAKSKQTGVIFFIDLKLQFSLGIVVIFIPHVI